MMATVTTNFLSVTAIESAYSMLDDDMEALENAIYYLSDFTVYSYDSWYAERIAGRFVNGMSFDIRGSGLLGYPCSISSIEVESYYGDIYIYAAGPLGLSSPTADLSGSINQLYYWSSGNGAVEAKGNVNASGDGTISEVIYYSEGEVARLSLRGDVALLTAGSSYDISPSGTFTSAELSYLGQTITVSNMSLDPRAIFASASEFLNYIMSGNDAVSGSSGSDWLCGYGGNDTLTGGAGVDVASYARPRSGYQLNYHAGTITVKDINPADGDDGTDTLIQVETLRFAGNDIGLVDGLEYIASNEDLISFFGIDAEAGVNHYIQSGYAEGRGSSFDGLEYIASNADLISLFGTDTEAGVTHYIQYGFREGRESNFDGLEYIASNADLISLFGTDTEAGVTHYIQYGFREGRATDFNVQQYLNSNPDIAALYEQDHHAAVAHYINYGHQEGRSIGLLGTTWVDLLRQLV